MDYAHQDGLREEDAETVYNSRTHNKGVEYYIFLCWHVVAEVLHKLISVKKKKKTIVGGGIATYWDYEACHVEGKGDTGQKIQNTVRIENNIFPHIAGAFLQCVEVKMHDEYARVES